MTTKCRSALFLGVFAQGIDLAANLERRTQLHVHGVHQMVFFDEHQCLAIDLLRPEFVRIFSTSLKIADKLIDIVDLSFNKY